MHDIKLHLMFILQDTTEICLLYVTTYNTYNNKVKCVSGACNQSLGMESGDIPDSAITASSSYVTNVGPRNGRWAHYFYDVPLFVVVPR